MRLKSKCFSLHGLAFTLLEPPRVSTALETRGLACQCSAIWSQALGCRALKPTPSEVPKRACRARLGMHIVARHDPGIKLPDLLASMSGVSPGQVEVKNCCGPPRPRREKARSTYISMSATGKLLHAQAECRTTPRARFGIGVLIGVVMSIIGGLFPDLANVHVIETCREN